MYSTELNSSKLSVGRSRRNSDSNVSCHSVHLGYPMTDFSRSASYADEEAEQERAYDDKKMTRSQAMKSARLAEAFGLQEAEAWEDFGRSAYDRASANRDTVYIPSASQLQDHGGMRPTKMDKASRANRVASVWDMEATLRENSPVAASECCLVGMWCVAQTRAPLQPLRLQYLLCLLAFRTRSHLDNPFHRTEQVSNDQSHSYNECARLAMHRMCHQRQMTA